MARRRRDKAIIRGKSGTIYVNNTDRTMYQLQVSFINTCSFCLQYHRQIAEYWPLPLHRHCRCIAVPIPPGGKAPERFVDYRKVIDRMKNDQKAAAVGMSAYKLIKAGLVKWEDVVFPDRVRGLDEIVRARRLSIKAMIRAGVTPAIARRAYAEARKAVPEPEARRHEARLLEALTQAWRSHEAMAEAIARFKRPALEIKPTVLGDTGFAARIQADLAKFFPPKVKAPPKPLRPVPKPKPIPIPVAAPIPTPVAPSPALPASLAGYPILPGQPIADRLTAWTEGDRLVGELAAFRKATAEEVKAVSDVYNQHLFQSTTKERKAEAWKIREEELRAKAEAAFQARYGYEAKAREHLQKTLAPTIDEQAAWVFSLKTPASDRTKDRIKEGQSFVTGLVRKRADGVGFYIEYHVHPSGYRAEAGGIKVDIQEDEHPRTVAHEIGHCMEDQIKGVVATEHEFLAHRAPGEARQKFKDLFPANKYRDEEEGVGDEFSRYFSPAGSDGQFGESAAYYAGKYYPNRSELLSMGIEALYEDAPEFARKDPEFCKFILGLLNGALR